MIRHSARVHWVFAFCIKSTNTATAETPSGDVQILMDCSQTISSCPLLSVLQHKRVIVSLQSKLQHKQGRQGTLGAFQSESQLNLSHSFLKNIQGKKQKKKTKKKKHRIIGLKWHHDILPVFFFKLLFIVFQCFYDFLFVYYYALK